MNKAGLTGKVAIVTGGAGGIGAAICQALAAEGARIAVGYNASGAAASALAAALPGGDHLAVAAPVTDSAALAKLAETVTAHYGRADILVNAAGTTRFVAHPDLDALDDALIDQILQVNVRGVIAATRAFNRLLQASGNGLVVNISSLAAVTGMGSNIAYCASKAAVDNLTKSLARALAPNVRVISVSPGLVDTPFIQGFDAKWRSEQTDRTALKRLAQPEEVAAAVMAAALHLPCSTGVVIPVDGGRPLN